MCDAFVRRGVGHTIVRCIRANLEGRLTTTTFNNSFRRVAMSRECPHEGVLLPLLWCFVIDDLIVRLNRGRVYTQGYADFDDLIARLKKGGVYTHGYDDFFRQCVNSQTRCRAHAVGP